jgi:hypothetical protein
VDWAPPWRKLTVSTLQGSTTDLSPMAGELVEATTRPPGHLRVHVLPVAGEPAGLLQACCGRLPPTRSRTGCGDRGARLGRHRYVVERSLAWLVGYRRLQVRYEWRDEILLIVAAACHPSRDPASPHHFLYEAAAWLADQVGTDLVEVPGGHMSYLTDPAAVAESLPPLLRELS